MNLRSKKYITKSNGFWIPLSRVSGHPHIVVLGSLMPRPYPSSKMISSSTGAPSGMREVSR
jgi:hypothetical protein